MAGVVAPILDAFLAQYDIDAIIEKHGLGTLKHRTQFQFNCKGNECTGYFSDIQFCGPSLEIHHALEVTLVHKHFGLLRMQDEPLDWLLRTELVKTIVAKFPDCYLAAKQERSNHLMAKVRIEISEGTQDENDDSTSFPVFVLVMDFDEK